MEPDDELDDALQTDYDSELDEEPEDESDQIGEIVAYLMQRSKFKNNFWRDVEEPSQSNSLMAFEIFDRQVYSNGLGSR